MDKCSECGGELIQGNTDAWDYECYDCGMLFDILSTGKIQKTFLHPAPLGKLFPKPMGKLFVMPKIFMKEIKPQPEDATPEQ